MKAQLSKTSNPRNLRITEQAHQTWFIWSWVKQRYCTSNKWFQTKLWSNRWYISKRPRWRWI